MKSYTVFKIKCRDSLSMADLFAYLQDKVAANGHYFAIQGLRYDALDKKKQKQFDDIGLDEFSYRVVLPHIAQSAGYDPDLHDYRMISNLDGRWNWPNPTCHELLPDERFSNLVAFCDRLGTLDIATMLVGLDELAWNGEPVGKGTYGYEKADCTYRFGENYLSNSVTIARDYQGKKYTACLSCEKRFVTVPIISEIVAFLGTVKQESTYFAPETQEERQEWNRMADDAKRRLDMAVARIEQLPLIPIERYSSSDETKKINVKKLIKQYLCTNGWEERKALPDEWPSIVCKAREDRDIKLSIVSGHNGHHLQALIYYRSPKFSYSSSLSELHVNSISEADVESYFLNAVAVRDCLDEIL